MDSPAPTAPSPSLKAPGPVISGSLHKLYRLGQRITPEDLAEEIEVGPPTVGRKWGGNGAKKPSGGPGSGSGTRSAVSLADLVKYGALIPGKGRISVSYKGTTVTAALTEDGSIEHQGRKYQSATAFSINFKRTITPSKQGDDGWKSVLYDGKPLEHYRKVYMEQHRHRNVPSSLQLQSLNTSDDEEQPQEQEQQQEQQEQELQQEQEQQPQEQEQEQELQQEQEQPHAAVL